MTIATLAITNKQTLGLIGLWQPLIKGGLQKHTIYYATHTYNGIKTTANSPYTMREFLYGLVRA